MELKELTIKFVVSEKDPMINIDSEDFGIRYTHTGENSDFHGLQVDFVESEFSEKYKAFMDACDTIAKAARKIYKLKQ